MNAAGDGRGRRRTVGRGQGWGYMGRMLSLVALCLTGHIDPTHFAGALTEEPADLSNVPVAELTPEQLVSEHKRLDKYRTEFILPVVLSAVGAVLVIGGAAFEVLGVFYVYLPTLVGGSMSGLMAFTVAGYVLLALGGAALIAGGVLLTIGLIKLFPALSRRRDAMERREEIQKRLDAADPEKQPQPPPMNPGDVRYEGPLPSMLLATF